MASNNCRIKILVYWKKSHKYEKQNDYISV